MLNSMTLKKQFAKELKQERWSVEVIKHQSKSDTDFQFLSPFDLMAINYNSVRLIAVEANHVIDKIQSLKEWAINHDLPRNVLIQVVFPRDNEWEIITL